MFQCFETPDMGPGIFTFLCFSLFRNVSKLLKVSCQFMRYISLYSLYVSMFRNVSKHGKTWGLCQFIRNISLYSLYVSMFQFVAKHMETHGVTCFNIVLKRFETGET